MRHVNTSEDRYLVGLKTGNAEILEEIYAQYHQAIMGLVKTNNGSLDDARDLFQEGLMLIYQKAQAPNFQLTSSFFTYFYGICRYLWMNKMSKKKRHGEVTLTEEVKSISDELSASEMEKNESYMLYREKFRLLGEDCQKVLSLFLAKKTMEEIMDNMGYASANYAKKRKFTCKKKLVSLIEKDPRYKELIAA